MASGAVLIIDPSGELMHMPPDMLAHSPFHDFLIPGLILFFVNGVGQMVTAIMSTRKNPSAGFVGEVFGLGLMIWLYVQVNMIGGGHILQYSYFAIGVLETALAFVIQKSLVAMGRRSHKTLSPDGQTEVRPTFIHFVVSKMIVCFCTFLFNTQNSKPLKAQNNCGIP